MRVCLYTETALPVVGGQELAIDALARQFLAGGHESLVLTLRPRHRQSADDRNRPYPVLRHRRYLSTRHLLDFYRTAISAAYRKHPFEILHCHNVYPAGYVAARWSAVRRVPLVVTSHACDIAPDSHLLRKPGVRQRVAQVLQQASAVIAISASVEQQLLRLGARADQIVTIANGVDVARLSQPIARPAGINPAVQPQRYFLFLGRLVERKGADLALEALRRSATAHEAQLVVAGAGPQRDQLTARAAAVGLADRVHFVGLVEGDTKTYLLQNAICTLVPSRISEGASLTVLESFAAGRPVIAAAVAGLADAIRHNETGWLVPENSPSALAAALHAASSDDRSVQRMGQIARRIARRFDWRTIADRHLALYERLLACRQRKAA